MGKRFKDLLKLERVCTVKQAIFNFQNIFNLFGTFTD